MKLLSGWDLLDCHVGVCWCGSSSVLALHFWGDLFEGKLENEWLEVLILYSTLSREIIRELIDACKKIHTH